MKVFDIRLGYLTGRIGDSEDFEGNMNFMPKDLYDHFKPEVVEEVTLRDYIFALIGSTSFPYRMQDSINKLFLEYRDCIDFERLNPYIIRHTSKILPTTSIATALKLFGLIDYINENSDIQGVTDVKYKYNSDGLHTFMNLNMKPLSDKFNDEGRRLLSKLYVTVLKRELPIDYGIECYNILYNILKFNTTEVPKELLFSVIAYSETTNDRVIESDDFIFYRKDKYFKSLAKKVLSTSKSVPMNEDAVVRFMQLPNVRDACNVVSQDLRLDAFEIFDVMFVVVATVGTFVEGMSKETLARLFKVLQAFNNICGHSNLSAQFLQDIPDKAKLFKKSVYWASNFNDTLEDVVVNAYENYFQLALLQFVSGKHKENIRIELNNLVESYIERRDTSILRQELERLKRELAVKDSEVSKLSVALSNSSSDNIHAQYYPKIKELSNEVRDLQKINDKLKLENEKLKSPEEVKVVNEPEHIDLREYRVVFVGHPEAESTVKKLGKKVRGVTFIDGLTATQEIEPGQMGNYDVMIYQWEFLQHKAMKYQRDAKQNGVRIVGIRGTNLDYWLSQLGEVLRT